jgi:hypothetical protein
MELLIALTDPSPGWLTPERLTIAGIVALALWASKARVYEWSWQVLEMKARLEGEIEKLEEDVARMRAERDEFKAHLFRIGGIVAETLPQVEQRLRKIEKDGA